jgi:Rrf2 family protein
MLKLNKKVEYALIVLLDLGERISVNAITTKELAQQYHMPYDLLGKVLQVLSKKSLIESVQGVKGGYKMTKSLSDISVQDVIEAVEGPISLTPCIAADHINCEQQKNCNIKTPMILVQNELVAFFRDISLDKLAVDYKMFQQNQHFAFINDSKEGYAL